MTTAMRGEVGTQIIKVRARYSADSMSVIEAQDYLYDLSCLLLVGYVLNPETSVAGASRFPWKRREGLAIRAANDTRVRSISYNSPLEIVLAISGLAGSAVLIAERLVHLYGEVQRTKVLRATSTNHVLAESIIRRELEQVLADVPNQQGNRWIEGAARAADEIEFLSVEREDD